MRRVETEVIETRENSLNPDTIVAVGGKKLKLADVIAQAGFFGRDEVGE